jgi:hypothetical protein
VPVAEVIRLDGTVVIVVEDGRKLTFFKDDITRTLSMPDSFPLEAMTADGDMVLESKPEKVRKPRGRKEKEQHAE